MIQAKLRRLTITPHPKKSKEPRPDLKYSSWANGQGVCGWRSQVNLLRAIKAFSLPQGPGSQHDTVWAELNLLPNPFFCLSPIYLLRVLPWGSPPL